MKILFLDRDGILNPPPSTENGGYLTRPEDFSFQEGILDLLLACTQRNIQLAVITNQQCIGKGILTEQGLQSIHNRIQELLLPHGVQILKFYHCPHLKSDGCHCRKPKPGMLLQAMQEGNWKPTDCGFLGDSKTDMLAGIHAGIANNFYFKTKEEDLSDLPPHSFQRVKTFLEVLH